MSQPLKIGNAQAFWGDRILASALLIEQQPDLDYLTLDYLSEVSLSIMAAQIAKDPSAGYAKDFVATVASLIPFWKKGIKVKLIANAGGLNPKGCALACSELLREAGCWMKIGIVAGDNVLEIIKASPHTPSFENLETKKSISSILADLSTANAYMGAKPIVTALELGADIIITGRVADPSLTVAPCIFHFGWKFDDYDRIAQATIAGHLLECGTQVTGGISTHWLEIPHPAAMGFPFVEVEDEGSFTVTKPSASGGRVSIETVKEQLLYEIGNPNCYLSPDATVSFLSLQLENAGNDRIKVSGGKGKPPPPTYKVSATFRDGYKAEAMLIIFGREARTKAQVCGEIILNRVQQNGFVLERSCIECLGGGGLFPEALSSLNTEYCHDDSIECVLRICVADHRREALDCFTKEIAPLVTSGPQGITGYATGRPSIRPLFGYWPCLIDVSQVNPTIELIEVTQEV